uniref:Uncharacterized protein n=1 Tax=Magnetococcus massalia (strain MO-1) TaxID=451514 RepID=A0A1S7LQY6_MAGMO|nr:protein of unknown function [Candidatus Magnetococcus massalia]
MALLAGLYFYPSYTLTFLAGSFALLLMLYRYIWRSVIRLIDTKLDDLNERYKDGGKVETVDKKKCYPNKV